MLLKITTRHVPTSATTAAQRVAYPAAATAIIVNFVTKERVTFCPIFQRQFCPSCTASANFLRSFVISATSAVSIATADPATPMAIPTSAAANAGPSFMPSPTIAVTPVAFKFLTIWTLSSGSNCEWTSILPSWKNESNDTNHEAVYRKKLEKSDLPDNYCQKDVSISIR
jgi:hypothetical protein